VRIFTSCENTTRWSTSTGRRSGFEFDGYGTAVTPTDKGYGAAESYSKKYALRSLFLIETDDDPDAGGENVNIATPQARASTGAPARVPRPAAAAEQPAIQTTAHPAAVEIPPAARAGGRAATWSRRS
jgi:hypothetical protein